MSDSEEQDIEEKNVFKALIADGILIPQTEAQVEKAEEEFENGETTLPEKLRKLPELDSSRPGKVSNIIDFPLKKEVSENLSRAAREGGNLTEAIERKMKEDRKKAIEKKEADEKEGPQG